MFQARQSALRRAVIAGAQTITRRIILALSSVGAACSLYACSQTYDNQFIIFSPDIGGNGEIQAVQVFNGFGCTGGNQSPALSWRNAPAGTQSFLITLYDRDAPTGSGFWHWTVMDLPPATTSLPTNAGTLGSTTLPKGALQGYTDFGTSAYGGPCPPVGDPPHHYTFTVYAMKIPSAGLTSGAPGALVSFVAKANSISSASFTATYGIPGTPTPRPVIQTPPTFTLTSAEIPANSTIKNAQVFNGFGCTGDNISPSLTWSGVPAGTKSLVLTVYDPDAPTGSGFWHWLVFDMPATATSLPLNSGVQNSTTIPPGALQGYTDFGFSGYGGPCPPAGDPPHHYIFTLYALPIPSVGLTSGATGGLLGFVVMANATDKATFTATYGR